MKRWAFLTFLASFGMAMVSTDSIAPVAGISAWMSWPLLLSMARWRAMLMSPE
jgi:hypothetical protein